jgi:hypothetical protein
MGEEEQQVYISGAGLDIGTSFLQVARETSTGQVEFVSERDAFYAIKPSSPIAAKFIEKSLRQKGAFVLKSEGMFFIVGKQAIETAIERGGVVNRPLKKGVLSMADKDSMSMLAVLIEALVKKPIVENEVIVYTYPANPVDGDFDIIYHQNRMSEILGNLGYQAVPLLEAEALAYSELMDYDLTGMAISLGAGMANFATFHSGDSVLSFSIAIGGDYIDKSVAKPLGITETEVQAEKESSEMDLNTPKGAIQETIVMYYSNFINYVADVMEKKFNQVSDVPKFSKGVPVILAGGSSIPKGFTERFDKALRERSFPFKFGDIKRAESPLTAVANGCLIYSQIMKEQ